MDKPPVVSVMTPFWDTPSDYLRECVESCLQHQSSIAREILLVDDGSTDAETISCGEQLANEYPDTIRYWRRPHKGLASARNFCLGKAQGSFVAVMDADDIMSPDRLPKQVRFFRNHPDYTLVSGDMVHIGPNGRVLSRARHSHNASLLPEEDHITIINHGTVMFKREAAEAAGGYSPYESSKPGGGEDAKLFRKMKALGLLKFEIMEEYFIQRRVWPGSLSFEKSKFLQKMWRRCT